MQYIRRLKELGVGDVGLVGGKNASLGELYRNLAAEGVKVPNGFATTAAAYRHYLAHNHLDQRIHAALNELDIPDVRALAVAGAKIRQWIMRGAIPDDLSAAWCSSTPPTASAKTWYRAASTPMSSTCSRPRSPRAIGRYSNANSAARNASWSTPPTPWPASPPAISR